MKKMTLTLCALAFLSAFPISVSTSTSAFASYGGIPDSNNPRDRYWRCVNRCYDTFHPVFEEDATIDPLNPENIGYLGCRKRCDATI
jgi:hypothetical protein